jgi:hypothetical protein
MREKLIEAHLVKRIREAGGMCLKFVSPGNAGVPDRIVFMYGMTALVEIKAPGKKPDKRQNIMHAKLAKHRIRVFVADSKEAVDMLVDNLVLKWSDGQ